MLLEDLLSGLFFCFFGGLTVVLILTYLVRRFGPLVLVTVGTISSVLVSAFFVYLVGEAPFLTETHLFFGAIIIVGGLCATWLGFRITKNAVIDLLGYEPIVNKTLAENWDDLDPKGLGFLSSGALRRLSNSLQEGSRFWLVVKHMQEHFDDITGGTSIIIKDRVPLDYIGRVREKYATWLLLAEPELKKHVCSSKCPITCGARKQSN
jgi:hypothetical protein